MSRAAEPETPVERPGAYRSRFTGALESLLAEKRFPKITIGDLVGRAHTSRRGFYEQFDSKEACLVALLKEAAATGSAQAAAAVDRTAPWQTQLRQLVTAWIGVVDARPAPMLSYIRDVPLLDAPISADLNQDAYVNVARAISAGAEFRESGGVALTRTRALILFGGLEKLAEDALQHGAAVHEHTEEAVRAAILLAAA
ncbi:MULTISPECIES: TetR/AcrR family transcriptional regulator [Amycolatopsis]|uniref:TetR/AcrR family transcriptional regulator n=1 Tax=Amycolatopsis dendrobii TaxID=2760662 RepID=A0A7W3VW92_9PSEU|nr:MULTISPECIES: TetR/AcrR family transcriptional regulator [Amycolatopsis]MBB1154389.1 TetR/AcrR family transcriptional regulator [Amycolatopsis dendrobii]UKD51237.1 TetR/AcrR family transcriptional regulator [Amycolatopsis sp. FU40]